MADCTDLQVCLSRLLSSNGVQEDIFPIPCLKVAMSNTCLFGKRQTEWGIQRCQCHWTPKTLQGYFRQLMRPIYAILALQLCNFSPHSNRLSLLEALSKDRAEVRYEVKLHALTCRLSDIATLSERYPEDEVPPICLGAETHPKFSFSHA